MKAGCVKFFLMLVGLCVLIVLFGIIITMPFV